MPVVELSDALDALHSRFIADMAAQRITRIDRIYHQPTAIDDRNRLLNQPFFRVIGVNVKILRHCDVGGIENKPMKMSP